MGLTQTSLKTGRFVSCTVNSTGDSWYAMNVENNKTVKIWFSKDCKDFSNFTSYDSQIPSNYGQIISDSTGKYVLGGFSNVIFINTDQQSSFSVNVQENNPDIIGVSIGNGDSNNPYFYFVAKYETSYKIMKSIDLGKVWTTFYETSNELYKISSCSDNSYLFSFEKEGSIVNSLVFNSTSTPIKKKFSENNVNIGDIFSSSNAKNLIFSSITSIETDNIYVPYISDNLLETDLTIAIKGTFANSTNLGPVYINRYDSAYIFVNKVNDKYYIYIGSKGLTAIKQTNDFESNNWSSFSMTDVYTSSSTNVFTNDLIHQLKVICCTEDRGVFFLKTTNSDRV